MSAQLFTTGPALIFVGVTVPVPGSRPVSTNPAFLGTTEFAPELHVQVATLPVHNDIGGPIVPFDIMYEGRQAHGFADLNYFDEAVLLACKNTPNPGNINNADEGIDFFGNVGMLLGTEGRLYTVWYYFPYGVKNAYGAMIKGYRFPASYLLGPHKSHNLGTKPRKELAVFHHIRWFDPSSGLFTLYDHNVTGLTSPTVSN
jgi:hypothetical protein